MSKIERISRPRDMASDLLSSVAMRWASIVFLVGCTSTRMVPRTELLRVENGEVGDGVVVKTTSMWKSRIDPTSKLRLFSKAREATDWLNADAVHVAPGWIYTWGVVDILDHTERIVIAGLDKGELDDLIAARPLLGAALEIDGEAGTALVQARGAILHTWMNRFIDAVGERHKPVGELHACAQDHSGWQVSSVGGTPSYQRCYPLHGSQGGRMHLRFTHKSKPLGTWTLQIDRHGPLEISGNNILDRLENGLGMRRGWRWDDVAHAEVEDFSGIKTLAAIIGTAGIVTAAAAEGHRMTIEFGDRHPPGTWKPTPADVVGRAAPPLFGSSARRRSLVRIAAQGEVAVDALGATQLFEGGTASVRLFHGLELGVGGAHLAVYDGMHAWNGGLAYFRFGAHLPIDAPQRWAIPLTMDVGGGGGEALGVFWRARTGVQRRLGPAFVGAHLTPTFLNWKHGGPTENAKRWSLTTGVEAGVAF